MVLVYSDDIKLTLELLNKGREISDGLGKKLTAVIIGKADESAAKDLIAHGADNVHIAETSFDSFKSEEYTDILKKIITKTGTETILIGSNKNGKELVLVTNTKNSLFWSLQKKSKENIVWKTDVSKSELAKLY